jgi:cellulose biosynthesis protein BcsQ
MTAEAAPLGRIVTFYSYKGGIGRSMAVANVAWMFANDGRRVLVIDWDLDSPGLHHHFRPFLVDQDLSASPGIIDFMVDFAEAASTREDRGEPGSYGEMANLLRNAASLVCDQFPPSGTLDFVPAGRQDAGYASKVNFFNWRHFYENLNGSKFLSAVERQLRSQYDYILIDSRTGVGDTSGTCTAQLPDDLVVCFALDPHSIEGALDAARAAHRMRRDSGSDRSLRIWPVAMRVDDTRRSDWEALAGRAHVGFKPLLAHLPSQAHAGYWSKAVVPYAPACANPQSLAASTPPTPSTEPVLQSLQFLTTCFAPSPPTLVSAGPPSSRIAPKPAASAKPEVLLSYAHWDNDDASGQYVTKFRQLLADAMRTVTGEEFTIWWDKEIPWGETWQECIDGHLDEVAFLLAIVTPSYLKSPQCRHELSRFIEREGKLGRKGLVLPVYLVEDSRIESAQKNETNLQKDELALYVSARQWTDWRSFHAKSLKSALVRRKVAELAADLLHHLQQGVAV